MQEELKQIADRIRGLREIKAVEPDTIARKLGISIAEYEMYESGELQSLLRERDIPFREAA